MFSYWYAEPNLSSFATFPLVHTGKTYQTKGDTNRFLDWIENSESWRKDFDLWNYEMETAFSLIRCKLRKRSHQVKLTSKAQELAGWSLVGPGV